MSYKYTKVDGQRVEVHVARAYAGLKREFEGHMFSDGRRYKLSVTWGTRTRAEQEALYKAWKDGTGSLAAVPGYSHHEADGPVGPRALDLRDSGASPGVTVMGTERSKYLGEIVARHGFDNAGFTFTPQESWHKEYTGSLVGAIPAAVRVKPLVKVKKEDDMPQRIPHTITRKVPQPVEKAWDWLRWNDAGDVSLAIDKGIMAPTLWLQLHGLPVAHQVQVRFVRSNPKNPKRAFEYPVTEIVGTAGDTFGQITGNFELADGDRLRVKLLAFDDGVTVAGGYGSTLVWKA